MRPPAGLWVSSGGLSARGHSATLEGWRETSCDLSSGNTDAERGGDWVPGGIRPWEHWVMKRRLSHRERKQGNPLEASSSERPRSWAPGHGAGNLALVTLVGSEGTQPAAPGVCQVGEAHLVGNLPRDPQEVLGPEVINTHTPRTGRTPSVHTETT